MRLVPRFAAVALLSLAVVSAAGPSTRPVAGSAPIGLRAFLLRADEPRRDAFPRTPSFAWTPVRGALKYEFQLATSSVFSDNGIVYSNANVRSPAVSVPMSLPWITGKPYSLYARVRATLPKRVTPWSAPLGFNMRWGSTPVPLSTYPGLLRWSPVEGATGYQVWLVDARKVFAVDSNVADQREYYSFHQSDRQWTSTVNWRVRAVRALYGQRANSLPAVSYGPWSPVYTAVNPPFAVGPLAAGATVSDVVSDAAVSPAHRLMPGFVFSGNRSIFGPSAELYRVYVFTDSECVNMVYRGAIVGSPAYAPRPLGPLALPKTDAELAKARSQFLPDGDEGKTYTADGLIVTTSESEKPTKPGSGSSGDGSSGSGSSGSGSGGTGGNPGGSGSSGNSGGNQGSSSSEPSQGSSATGGQAGAGTSLPAEQTREGAPVDLWDTDAWPRGGYYWTVVPVAAVHPDPFGSTLNGPATRGATTIELASVAGLAAGDSLAIGDGSNRETVKVLSISGTTVTLSAALVNSHAAGELAERPSTQLEYVDQELPQEACAAGRVMRFGKQSEPSLTASGAPFVSGLSPNGRLIAASRGAARFYGPPLVAWTPALGATGYEVQWSKSAYPFRPEANRQTRTVGLATFATSATLPLQPGTWYYRVRGINLSLPGTAKQMSWSQPVKLIVTKPRFVVVR
jgi:hypothetical protein